MSVAARISPRHAPQVGEVGELTRLIRRLIRVEVSGSPHVRIPPSPTAHARTSSSQGLPGGASNNSAPPSSTPRGDCGRWRSSEDRRKVDDRLTPQTRTSPSRQRGVSHRRCIFVRSSSPPLRLRTLSPLLPVQDYPSHPCPEKFSIPLEDLQRKSFLPTAAQKICLQACDPPQIGRSVRSACIQYAGMRPGPASSSSSAPPCCCSSARGSQHGLRARRHARAAGGFDATHHTSSTRITVRAAPAHRLLEDVLRFFCVGACRFFIGGYQRRASCGFQKRETTAASVPESQPRSSFKEGLTPDFTSAKPSPFHRFRVRGA